MAIPVDGMTDDARAAITELLELRGQPIVLTPATGVVTDKPGGGRDYAAATPRDPQVFAKFNKVFAKVDRLGEEHSQTDGGTVRQFKFEMIGAYDSVIALGDSWEDDAAKYEVDGLDLTLPYQIRATVIAWLKVPGHSG